MFISFGCLQILQVHLMYSKVDLFFGPSSRDGCLRCVDIHWDVA